MRASRCAMKWAGALVCGICACAALLAPARPALAVLPAHAQGEAPGKRAHSPDHLQPAHEPAHSAHGGHGDFMGLRLLGGVFVDERASPMQGMGLSLEHPHLVRGVDVEVVGAWMTHQRHGALALELLLKHPLYLGAHDEIFVGAGGAAAWAVPAHGLELSPGVMPGGIGVVGFQHWFGPHLGASVEGDYTLRRAQPRHSAQEFALAVSVTWRLVASKM